MNIKEKVDAIRKEKKMTWEQLAEKSKLTRYAFLKWDEHSPSIKNLQSVADALGVKVTDLMGD